MDPTQSIDGPFGGFEPDEEDMMAAPSPEDPSEPDQTRGPGDGDAQVMAWARAM